jgi:DNA-binding transcriptional LysR family regulator
MMERGTLDDLAAFAAVARARSFRRAAGELGLSTSALSYTIKRLEERLGLRLLKTLDPALGEIGSALEDLDRERGSVSGTVRITATRQGYEAVIRPILADFGAEHPAAKVEVLIDYEFRDIIANRLDAGIRLGEKLELDMIALRVGPELRMAVVASPDYLAAHPVPQTPSDLTRYRCINYRMSAAGGIYAWEFERGGREIEVKVEGPLTFNEPEMMLNAAVDGLGVAYVLEDRAKPFIAAGRLVRLLEDWTAPFPGFFVYYPSRRQVPPTLAALLAILRRQPASSTK